MIRATVFYSGGVQGVGFRFTTNEIAARFAVLGTVENCNDGRVKLVVEAESVEVERFLEAIQRAMNGKIQNTQRFDSESSGEFVNFSVRR